MPLFLSKRKQNLVEQMDRPDCDRELLANTYRQFANINRLLSGWEKIYKKLIKPVLKKRTGPLSILDIGCGGGDIVCLIHRLCTRDGFTVTCTGIDTDERAISFANRHHLHRPDRVYFQNSSSRELAEQNKRFDIVISNHLMHHLTEKELLSVCNDASGLANHLVIFSDIERSDLGYAVFQILAPLLFRNSFIVSDGLTSIRRSFRKAELRALLPPVWNIRRSFPFRLIAVCKTSG